MGEKEVHQKRSHPGAEGNQLAPASSERKKSRRSNETVLRWIKRAGDCTSVKIDAKILKRAVFTAGRGWAKTLLSVGDLRECMTRRRDRKL